MPLDVLRPHACYLLALNTSCRLELNYAKLDLRIAVHRLPGGKHTPATCKVIEVRARLCVDDHIKDCHCDAAPLRKQQAWCISESGSPLRMLPVRYLQSATVLIYKVRKFYCIGTKGRPVQAGSRAPTATGLSPVFASLSTEARSRLYHTLALYICWRAVSRCCSTVRRDSFVDTTARLTV